MSKVADPSTESTKKVAALVTWSCLDQDRVAGRQALLQGNMVILEGAHAACKRCRLEGFQSPPSSFVTEPLGTARAACSENGGRQTKLVNAKGPLSNHTR